MLNITLLLFWLGRPASKVEMPRPTQASSYAPGLISMTQQLLAPNTYYEKIEIFKNMGPGNSILHDLY